MAFSLIGTRTKAATGVGTTTLTTDSLDMTGAGVLVACVAWYTTGSVTATVTDSLGNTWTPLTTTASSSSRFQAWYSLSPSSGPSHTVTSTWSANGNYGVLSVVAYGGAASYQGLVSAVGSGTSLAVGPITPGLPGSLAVSSLMLSGGAGPQGATATNNAGLTSFGVNFASGVTVGATTAHGVLAGASPLTVTHSWTNSGNPIVGQTLIFNPTGTILPLVLHHRRMQGAF